MNEELLRELEGDTVPLLTRFQLRFLDEVQLAVDNTYINNQSIDDEIYDDDERIVEIVETITAIENNLKIIINRLKGGRTASKKFLTIYPKWKKIRDDGIEQLRDISQSIQTDRFNCNVSKLVGYCVSFVGGAVTLTSAALIPFTLGLTTPLAVAGGSMTAAGASTAFGTSITEIVLLKNKISKAQEIVDEDKKYFQEMNDWIEHATELEKALSEVLKIDIVKDIIESVKELVKKGTKIKNDYERLNYITRMLNQIRTHLPQEIARAVPLYAVVSIITLLVTIFLLISNVNNRFVFECASLTIRTIVGIASLTDDVLDIGRIARIFTGNAALAKDVTKAVTRGAVAVIGMALDVAGIALTSIDIHKGSSSPEAIKIAEAADEMEKEAKIFQDVYENMNEVQ